MAKLSTYVSLGIAVTIFALLAKDHALPDFKHTSLHLPSVSADSVHGTVGQEQAYAQQVFNNGPIQQHCLVLLWNQESGWRADAVNSQTGANGIPQENPYYFGHPYSLTDWEAQIRWGKWYIDNRYQGLPCNAWAHEQAANWY